MAKHLSKAKTIQLGSFYTPKFLVEKTYKLLEECTTIKNKNIIDLASGYGDFLNDKNNYYGVDIDEQAYKNAKIIFKKANLLNRNSLTLEKLNFIKNNNKNIIIGNPPYNYLSSLFKKGEKGSFMMRDEYISRDLGLSFLKMFSKMDAEYVAVLHPLSFLIKKNNFKQAKSFFEKYKLVNSEIVSSKHFEETAKKPGFPIIIAVYKKSKRGMHFDDIFDINFKFFGIDKEIRYGAFKVIDGFIKKYPTKDAQKTKNMFYTMRDNNALIRSATWLSKPNSGTIFVQKNDIWKYNYIDIYKGWLKKNIEKIWPIGNLSPILVDGILKDQTLRDSLNQKHLTKKIVLSVEKILETEIGEKIW